MKYTKEYLELLAKEAKCMWELVEKTGMSKQQGNYTYLHRLITRYNISTKHLEDQRKGQNKKSKDISEYLVEGKFLTLSGNKLKYKLYKAGLKYPVCEMCGQDENWRGMKISLILDHIDGNRDNNSLKNLRIVCPNCNATLPTHGGKNRKK